ncbi:hypothetical protein P280DRAFT_468002 [Massarina eburnea CBS 473.64]|uniref:Mid2 domain-containing protein n=1 Tax=Massarina eburnea CBS 473.64 TaxID=1395130 RepID=A0A6A6S5Z9_9PLEO|nr:hypothetical protein P280DRAFT_468002 [Massarina eburnea CBS 473.64]
MRSLLLGCCWASSIISAVAAENTNNQFNEPDGGLDDFSQTYTIGDTLNIKWRAGWWGSDKQPDNVDLFVTWFKSDSYSHRILTNTSVKQAGFFPWKINVTDSVVKADNKFDLRFRPHRDPGGFNNGGPMAPSRGFLLQLAVLSSSRSSSPAPTSTSTMRLLTASTSSLSTPTPTPTASASREKSSTPLGTILGGVLGAVAVIALIVIAFLMLRMSKKKKQQQAAAAGTVGMTPPGYGSPCTELGTTWTEVRKCTHVSEAPPLPPLKNNVAVELDATYRVYEAGAGEYQAEK